MFIYDILLPVTLDKRIQNKPDLIGQCRSFQQSL